MTLEESQYDSRYGEYKEIHLFALNSGAMSLKGKYKIYSEKIAATTEKRL